LGRLDGKVGPIRGTGAGNGRAAMVLGVRVAGGELEQNDEVPTVHPVHEWQGERYVQASVGSSGPLAHAGDSGSNTATAPPPVRAACGQQAARGAARRGVLRYACRLAATRGWHRIRANAMLCALVRTPRTEVLARGRGAQAEQLAQTSPLGTVGRPHEVGCVGRTELPTNLLPSTRPKFAFMVGER